MLTGILIEFYKCKIDLEDKELLLSIIKSASLLSNGTIVEAISKRINTHNVVTIAALTESYIALHSFAKKKLCRCYLFNYAPKKVNFEIITTLLRDDLGAKDYKIFNRDNKK